MKNKLEIKKSGEVIHKVTFNENEETCISVGREGNNDIIINTNSISRQHVQILQDADNNVFLIDLNSTNGTLLDNVLITPDQPTKFLSHQSVVLGNSDVQICYADNAAGYSKESNVTQHGDLQNKELSDLFYDKKIVSIGRSTDNDVVLPSSAVSRLHCTITKLQNGDFELKDNDSSNGTFINGKRVRGKIKLQTSDKIMLGKYILSLSGKTKNLDEEIAIKTEGITKVYGNGYVGLNKTSISVAAGKMIAIMGPSGCGKSTLMKCLNGESPATQGKVHLFGQELLSNYEYIKTLVGYVPQDDIVHRDLTVQQSLYYAAKLRLENAPDDFINKKIDEILANLHISHIKNHLISKISGGQRKRVSIAVELLTDPMILFLDEPTSPLDPQTIEEFLGILRKLAKNGTTVVLVTHKPEDLWYMDEVIFLAEGGHLVYKGEASKYQEYFQVDSPVEVYANISGERSKKWVGKFPQEEVKSNASKQSSIAEKIQNTSDANPIKQWWWLTRRYFSIKLNDKVNTLILIGQAPIIALLISIIFDEITIAIPFLMAVSAIWFGVNNSAREIVSELPIYLRERMFNLKINSYILSKLSVLSFFAFVQSVLFIVIITISYNSHEVAWFDPVKSILWMFMLSVVATLFGLTLSAAVKTSEKVMTLVPLTLIPQIMLAGVVTKISSGLVEILSYVTLSRWGTEGFAKIQGKVMGSTAEIKDEDAISVTIEKDEYDMPVFEDDNPVIEEVDMGEDNFETIDEIQNAVENIHDQFHTSYFEMFGNAIYGLKIDFLAVLFMGALFFTVTIILLKRKDAI